MFKKPVTKAFKRVVEVQVLLYEILYLRILQYSRKWGSKGSWKCQIVAVELNISGIALFPPTEEALCLKRLV